MSTDRDTHFAGFAKLLFDELGEEDIIPVSLNDDQLLPVWRDDTLRLLARRAYDLVFGHALVYLREGADIPDMAEWPVERDE